MKRALPHDEAERRFTDRLLAGFVTTGTGCWEWTGKDDGKGYGTISRRKPDGTWAWVKTHRASYEHHIGPIPEGLQLDHLCRNRLCGNPEHLEPVTNRENGLRGFSVCADNARKTHCVRGHEFTPETTRFRSTGYGTIGRGCSICEAELRRKRANARATCGPHRCPECSNRYETSKSLRIHMARLHGAVSVVAAVEGALRTAGYGLTDLEIAARTGRDPGAVATERGTLVRGGLVCPLFDADGKQVTRPAPSGARSLVWVHVDHVGQVAA